MKAKASDILQKAEEVIKKALTLCGGIEHRSGGYICLLDTHWRIVLISYISTINEEKISKYLHFAKEKAKRLCSKSEHVSSWQSRDLEKEQYAGAIRGKTAFLSFSGLPELLDEASMLVLAILLGELSEENAQKIALISNNGYFQKLYNLTITPRKEPNLSINMAGMSDRE